MPLAVTNVLLLLLCLVVSVACSSANRFYLPTFPEMEEAQPLLANCGLSLHATHLYFRFINHPLRTLVKSEASYAIFPPYANSEEPHYPQHNTFWPASSARPFLDASGAVVQAYQDPPRKSVSDCSTIIIASVKQMASAFGDRLVLFIASNVPRLMGNLTGIDNIVYADNNFPAWLMGARGNS